MREKERLERLAKAWISHVRDLCDERNEDEHCWAADQVLDLSDESPDDCWQIILLILSLDGSTHVLDNLASGPLEGLLKKHGETVIGRLEQEARVNPKLRALLAQLWQNDIPDSIWKRVRAVHDLPKHKA